MLPRAVVAPLICFALLLSGCAGGTPSATTPTSAETLEPPATGPCIQGTILDDELRPVWGATLRVVETNQTAASDRTGSFRLCGLAPGTYTVEASKPGFKSRSVKVETRDGSGELRIELASDLAPEPYIGRHPFSVFYEFGYTTVDTTTSRYGVNLTNCGPCTFQLSTPLLPDHVAFEAYWTRNLMPPVAGSDLMYHIFRGGRPFESGTDIGVGAKGQPFQYVYDRVSLKRAPPVAQATEEVPFSGSMYCSGYAPCLDQRINVIVSAFYHYDLVPSDYTALPPR